VVLARRFLVCGSDCVLDKPAILSVISSVSVVPLGGVERGVSESVVSSYVRSDSPLLRGLGAALIRALISADILEKGCPRFFGSLGMGLFGSLESQLGMLLCRCCIMLESNEARGLERRGSCSAAIVAGIYGNCVRMEASKIIEVIGWWIGDDAVTFLQISGCGLQKQSRNGDVV
jgi:hypothetical protein